MGDAEKELSRFLDETIEKWTKREEQGEQKTMLNTEHQYIIERIRDRSIQPPTGMTLDNLNSWLTGYAQCQTDVLKILEELQTQDNRR